MKYYKNYDSAIIFASAMLNFKFLMPMHIAVNTTIIATFIFINANDIIVGIHIAMNNDQLIPLRKDQSNTTRIFACIITEYK